MSPSALHGVFLVALLVFLCLWAGCAEPASGIEPAAASAPGGLQVEQTPEGCVIRRYTVASPAMGRDVRVAVLLPPAYASQPEHRFPVLFALHGMGAPFDTWLKMAPLRHELQRRPMLVVAFDGDRAGWYLDAPRKPDSQFETFFFETLLPHVDAAYRTDGRRAVTGFSMGGFGAMHYLLCRPDRFVSASAVSASLRYFDRSGPLRRVSASMEALLGSADENADAYAALSVKARLSEAVATGVPLPPILLAAGTEEGAGRGLCEAATFLMGLRQKTMSRKGADGERPIPLHVELHLSPGGHNWAYWKGISPLVADFHWRAFQPAGP